MMGIKSFTLQRENGVRGRERKREKKEDTACDQVENIKWIKMTRRENRKENCVYERRERERERERERKTFPITISNRI